LPSIEALLAERWHVIVDPKDALEKLNSFLEKEAATSVSEDLCSYSAPNGFSKKQGEKQKA
jgi:hypothetical protein